MKKAITILLAFAMTFALAACGGSGSAAPDTAASTPAASTPAASAAGDNPHRRFHGYRYDRIQEGGADGALQRGRSGR